MWHVRVPHRGAVRLADLSGEERLPIRVESPIDAPLITAEIMQRYSIAALLCTAAQSIHPCSRPPTRPPTRQSIHMRACVRACVRISALGVDPFGDHAALNAHRMRAVAHAVRLFPPLRCSARTRTPLTRASHAEPAARLREQRAATGSRSRDRG